MLRRLRRGTLVAFALIAAAGPGAAQLAPGGWPKFRGNAAGTGLSAYAGPQTAAFGWAFTTGGAIVSSPAIGDDATIYFVSQDRYLYALNPDGTQRWRYYINSTSYSSPAVAADGTVYVGSDDYFVYAINPDGSLKWRKGLGTQIKSSPAIAADGTVYIGLMTNKLYAFGHDGSVRWSYTVGNPITSTAAIGPDGTVYFGSQDAGLYAVNPNGTHKWRFSTYQWVESSPAIGPDGTIYVGSKDTRIYAVNPNGTQKWNYVVGAQVKSSPAVGPDGTIYVGADDRYVYALNPNGTLKWRYLTGGLVQSSPAVGSDGVVYVGSLDGNIYALNPNGTLLWQYYLAGQVTSSPAIGADSSLCVGSSDKKLYFFSGDQTPPTTPVVIDDGVYSTSASTLHASWSSEDPETGIVEYRYAIGTTPGGTDLVNWTSAGMALEITRSDLALANGATYYFSVKAWSGAHLWSAVGVSDGIKLDFTGPVVQNVTDDGEFTASLTTLHAAWSAADPESAVVEYQYAIGTSPGASNIAGWASTGLATGVTRQDLSLVNGGTYFFSVKARNEAGLWGAVVSSNGITVDQTPPGAPSVTDDGQYTATSTSLHAAWSAVDAESGIGEYEYAIGTSPGATNVSPWTSVGAATSATRTGLALADGVTYYFTVRARNRAGMWGSSASSDGIMVDASAPSLPAVTDDGDYTSSADTLHASWSASDAHSGVGEYQYCIGTTPGGTDLVSWTSVGASTSVTRSGLALVNGATYYFGVRAANRAGVWSGAGVSDGIMVERTAPPPPTVVDDGAYTTSSSSLHATWTGTDPESGISEFQYAIGTTPGGTQTVGWTAVGSATSVTRSGLTLSDGVTYYFSVRARNRAGQWGDPGTSDGIVVDASAPTTPSVTDDGLYTSSANTLHAVWTAADPHTAIAEYQYAIGTTPGATNTVNWTSTGSSAEVTRSGLVLLHGTTYYFAVKARNAAGLWSAVGVSNGILVDHTGPAAPTVTDDGDYTASATSLHATWSATDAESGIAEYEYAIGTAPGSASVAGWTTAGTNTEVTRGGLILTDAATYYFSVRARNQAGIWGGMASSNGIIVDASPPTVPVVVDDGEFTASPDTLHATWTASDPQSGVAEYQYAVGTAPGAADLVNWTSNGTAAQITRTGLALIDGATYYFSVRARNRAGGWSSYGTSDGITIERTPPLPAVVTDDGFWWGSATSLHATWAAIDPESGVVEYQYAIGASPGGTQIVDWTPAGSATEITRTGLSLSEGVTYYFSVKAKNGVGLWGNAGSSDGIRLDLTPPSTPSVIDDGEFTSSYDMLSASWSAIDPQSGIREYEYAIGTAPGASDVVEWTSVGEAGEVTAMGLVLSEDRTYYFAVKARNGAGTWSQVGVSDGIMVLGAPGWPKFRADNKNRGVSNFSGCRTGALLWSYPTAGWVESSPTIGGDGTVYIGSGDGALYAIRRSGALLWKYQTAGPIDSSPTIGGNGRIYFGSYDHYIYCLTPAGTLRWRFGTEDMVWSSPLVGPGEIVYCGSQDGSVYAINPDGTLKWRYVAGGAVWSSPALSDSGVLYFGCNDGYIYAVNASNGTLAWKYQTGSAVDSSPAIGPDGAIYAGSGDGFFYALNPDGTLKWTFMTTWAMDSSAAIAPDGTIYVGVGNDWSFGQLYALNPNGSQKWVFDAHGAVRSSPAVAADGTVYFGSGDGNIYCLDSSGTMLWSHYTGWAVLSSPAIGKDGTICIGSYSGSVFAFKDSDINDTTRPTKPVVTDEGAATLSTTSLSATWVSSDPESGIAEYIYAIGTWPETDDVVPWTSAGMSTSVVREGLNLIPGQTYYFSVKSKNGARIWSLIGCSDGIVAVPGPPCTIADAKAAPDGAVAYLAGNIVTAAFADCFYVEDTERLAGIRVIPGTLTAPQVGRLVTLVGALTTTDGERAILLKTMDVGASVPLPAPIGMPHSLMGGGAPAPMMPSVEGGVGLNNVGLLLVAWGRVTSVGSNYFFIDDGCRLPDPSGAVGLKVSIAGTSIAPPAVGEMLRVRGVLGMEAVNGTYRRVLRLRYVSDVNRLN